MTTSIGRRTLMGAAAAACLLPRSVVAASGARWWPEGPVLNQFDTTACEAFALVAGWMSATRYTGTARDGNRLARHLFSKAGGTEDGANSEQVLPAARDLGLVADWTWLDTVDDVVEAVRARGPVPLGMRLTDRLASCHGAQAFPGSGSWIAHGMCATAYHPNWRGKGPALRLRNSWGPRWGVGGSAWMTTADLARNWGARPHIGYYRDSYAATYCKEGP